MTTSMQRCLLGLAIGATFAFGVAPGATAKSAYDGDWSVLIVTERGTCDRGYRYPVKIANGVVLKPSTVTVAVKTWSIVLVLGKTTLKSARPVRSVATVKLPR